MSIKNIATVKTISDFEVIVEVIHTNEKSYSKSVEPAGKKAFMNWRKAGNGGSVYANWRWTLVDSEEVDENTSKYFMTFEKRGNN